MRYSGMQPKTRREDPRDASSPGTALLMKAGFIHKVGAGIWTWAPFGLRVRRKCEQIVRREMELMGALEVELPILQPREFWDETHRWEKYLKSGIAFILKDHRGQEHMLAPTAEELVVEFARNHLRSYKDLPTVFWQMSPKYRDEMRPRQGVIRAREFLMKDAYSFDATDAGMRLSYQRMVDAYHHIFTLAGFRYIQVEADSGAIGGQGSSEFMAVTEHGEDALLHCSQCHYGANQEKATARFSYPVEAPRALEKIPTPNIRTVEELQQMLGFVPAQMVKTIVMLADGVPVIVSMRGDLAISEIKLANLLKATEVGTADAETVVSITGAPVGFAGPINLFDRKREWASKEVRYLFDNSVAGLSNFLCGGNQEDVHYINVNMGRDFPAPTEYYDLSVVTTGLGCPKCAGTLEMVQGIELGHVFQLQQIYSKPMNAVFRNEAGEEIPYWMGCYGIGVSRMAQAIVEQSHDKKGIIWPVQLAPYHVVIVPATPQGVEMSDQFYFNLKSPQCAGLEVMLDDRNEERFGVKITDAELIGYPVIVVLGRKIEVRFRHSGEVVICETLQGAQEVINDFVRGAKCPVPVSPSHSNTKE